MEERAFDLDGIKHYFIVNFPHVQELFENLNDILGTFWYHAVWVHQTGKRRTGPVLIKLLLADVVTMGLINRIEHGPFFINLNGNETL